MKKKQYLNPKNVEDKLQRQISLTEDALKIVRGEKLCSALA